MLKKYIKLFFILLSILNLNACKTQYIETNDTKQPEGIKEELTKCMVCASFKPITKDTAYILLQDKNPSFIFIGDFTKPEFNKVKEAIDEASKNYGFNNISYLLDLGTTDYKPKNNLITVDKYTFSIIPSIIYQQEGNIYYEINLTQDTTAEDLNNFFKLVYNK